MLSAESKTRRSALVWAHLLSDEQGCKLQGVASILDEAHNAVIDDLCAELKQLFGLSYACIAFPHFSYQIVENYDVLQAQNMLRRLAQETAPFQIRTSGLGIFTGERPVLFVRLVRDHALTQFHQRLWESISPFASGIHDHHYAPQNWIPHVTLAIEDLTHDNLPDAIRLLSRRDFSWRITIDNVCLVLDTRGTRDQWARFDFGA